MKTKEYKGIKLHYHENPTASHQLALIAAVENTTGDVLELGMGLFSTPLLRAALSGTGRKLLSLESDREWFARMQMDALPNCDARQVDDWMAAVDECTQRTWGMVFVDQSPQLMRYYSVLKLASCAQIIVAHDADHMNELRHGPYHCFKYTPDEQAHRRRRGPPTFLISKIRNADELAKMCQ